MSHRPIVVVGSGPAGVSAAWPLVRAGLPVVMVDAGRDRFPVPPPERPAFSVLRRGAPGALGHLLGANLDGLRDMRGYSPKLRTSAPPDFINAYAAGNAIRTEGFSLVGTFAAGGLSNLWGAAASLFDRDDLGCGAIGFDELLFSARSVAKRIGLNGVDDDDMAKVHGLGLPLQPPPPLAPGAAALMRAYGSKPASDFILGRARSAVLCVDLGERQGCNCCGGCMWSCPRRSIYNSADELPALSAHSNFTLLAGVTVARVVRSRDGVAVLGHDAEGREIHIEADRVLLAAGAVATTRLALEASGRWNEVVPIRTAPALAFAAIMPRLLGSALPQRSFGLAQLAFRADLGGGSDNYAFGLLYAAESMAAPDLIAHMPLSRRGATDLLRTLLPGLIVGLIYLPGECSASTGRLIRNPDGTSRLEITGGFAESFHPTRRHAITAVAAALRRLGAWLLPGSAKAYTPGAEVHYGGSLPLGQATDTWGELQAVPGLHVVDGALLPRMPAKHHTFTVMALADRIGSHLAEPSGTPFT